MCCRDVNVEGSVSFSLSVTSGATGEETSDARPPQPGAGRPGDAVSLRAAGPAGQGADAAGEKG